METRLRTHMDALRVLARSNDLNQVILVERNIDEYLQTSADQLDDQFHETTQLHLGLTIHGMRPFRASHMIRTLETLV